MEVGFKFYGKPCIKRTNGQDTSFLLNLMIFLEKPWLLNKALI